MLMYKRNSRSKEFLHFDPIKGMNWKHAQEMVCKLNKIEKRIFPKKIKETECPRQTNSFDCGIYVVLFIKKIIETLAEKREDIEEISIEPREATEYRKFLQIILEDNMVNNINKKVNKQSNPGKRIHKNWIYFRDLEKRIKNYPKIEKNRTGK